jgi:hypothetical protein
MRVVLDLAGNLLRASGDAISRLRLTRCSWFAWSQGVVAFFTMLFLSIANGGVWATNGPPRNVPTSRSDQLVHGGFVRADYLSSHGDKIYMASNDRAPMAYFLDELPADFELTKLPSEAKDVVIARVRATEPPSSLGGRDQSGVPAAERPRDKLFTRIKILDVRLGSASIGGEYAVYFGESGHELIYPLAPDQLHRDYVVVMYRDALDAKYRLIGFPASYAHWLDWQAQISKYQRSLHKN